MAEVTSTLIAKPSSIVFYTSTTPDCVKVGIVLDELRLAYKLHEIDVTKEEQKAPWFLEINPNGRIPALTDQCSDGSKVCLFESGSIMQYLIEQYDTDLHIISFPTYSSLNYEVNNWLFFQNTGITPIQGQATHFLRYAPQRYEYPLSRFQNEVRRLHKVLDTRLSSSTSGYLVEDRCTVADIAHWGWIILAFWAGIDMEEFPHLVNWKRKMVLRMGPEGRRYLDFITKLETDSDTQAEAVKVSSKWILEAQDKLKAR